MIVLVGVQCDCNATRVEEVQRYFGGYDTKNHGRSCTMGCTVDDNSMKVEEVGLQEHPMVIPVYYVLDANDAVPGGRGENVD